MQNRSTIHSHRTKNHPALTGSMDQQRLRPLLQHRLIVTASTRERSQCKAQDQSPNSANQSQYGKANLNLEKVMKRKCFFKMFTQALIRIMQFVQLANQGNQKREILIKPTQKSMEKIQYQNQDESRVATLLSPRLLRGALIQRDKLLRAKGQTQLEGQSVMKQQEARTANQKKVANENIYLSHFMVLIPLFPNYRPIQILKIQSFQD